MLKKKISKKWLPLILSLVMVMVGMCTFIVFPMVVSAGTQATYYVSPTGNDSNAGTEAAPFKTITKARDVVRTINSNMTGDIIVYLRGGTYDLTSTIQFTPSDSGTNGYRVYYQAYSGETPVISGATQVTGWTQDSGSIYKATLSSSNKLRTLIVNDQRAYMANKSVSCSGSWGTYSITSGQADWAWISGSKADGAKYSSSSVGALENAGDVEIVNSTTWNQNIVCVREITLESSSRILKFQQPMGAIALNQGWSAGFATSGTHKIQNAKEFLDAAGEFYFNKSTSTLYYYKGSEDMSTAVVYAPLVGTLIDVSGASTSNRVKNITFKGITFANTEAVLPQVAGSYGKTSVQGATWCLAFANSDWHADKYRAYDVMSGAVNVTSADSINFTENTLKHIGNEGISLINDVCNCSIIGNLIKDIGGSGIQVGHPQHVYSGDGGTHEKYSYSVEGVCKNNTIKNNYIYSATNMYYGHAGITGYFVENLNIEHNQIEGTNYGGVSLGWGWCNFDETAVPGNPTTTCKNNKFNYNRVFSCMKTLSDSGAFYTLGSQPNSQANNNYVKDTTTHFQGVYHPDEGTAWYNGSNLVFDIVSGQDNFELNDWGRKHDNHYDNIYTTSSSQQTGAPNCTITNEHVYSSSANFPQAALDIIASAGLEPAYQYLLGGSTPTPTPTQGPTTTPTPSPTPGGTTRYEAENAALSGGAKVNTDHTGYSGTGFVDGYYNVTGAETKITVSASAAGSYNVTLRYGAGGGTSTNNDLYVNDVKIKDLSCSGTGSWDTWADLTEPVSLKSGSNTIAYKSDSSSTLCINLDYIDLTLSATATPTPTGGATPTPTPTPGGQTQLFSDGFESNNFTAGGWTNSGCDIQTTYKYSGTYAVRFNSSDSLTKALSTAGYSSIQVKYVRYTRNCETDDHFICEWYDGSTWATLEDLTGSSSWTLKTWDLPSGANNNVNFQLRFKTTHNGSSDYAYLDDVQILGAP